MIENSSSNKKDSFDLSNKKRNNNFKNNQVNYCVH